MIDDVKFSCCICAAAARIHVVEPTNAANVLESHFCRQHILDYLNTRRRSGGAPKDAVRDSELARPFALDYLMVDDDAGASVVGLVECSGSQGLTIGTGLCEAASIVQILRGYRCKLPLTHTALANAVEAVGGIINDVLIYELEDLVFFAKLRINVTHLKQVVYVDIRATDGIAVALNRNAPILVAETVLARVPTDQQK